MSDSQFNRILKIKDVVKRVLEDHPETRDNDRLLILKVWKEQHPSLIDTSFRDFSVMYLDKKFMDTESIRRSRQKTQEQHPNLRGRNYVLRQQGEEEMRDLITGVEIQ